MLHIHSVGFAMWDVEVLRFRVPACGRYGGEEVSWWALNFVWENWCFKLLAKFTTTRGAAKEGYPQEPPPPQSMR